MINRIINKVKREWRKVTAIPRDQQPELPDYWFREVYSGKVAQVVQIGSNDGKTGDPLHKLLLKNKKWKGLFVEPIPYVQLGSFDRNHLTQHLDGKLIPFIKSLDIKGMTLPEVLDQWKIDQIDILHIDCEGYDWKVLSQLDLTRYRPGLILFEYHHLAPEELAAARDFLSADYKIKQLGIDYLAIRKERV